MAVGVVGGQDDEDFVVARDSGGEGHESVAGREVAAVLHDLGELESYFFFVIISINQIDTCHTTNIS